MLVTIISALIAIIFGLLYYLSDGHGLAKDNGIEEILLEDSRQAKNISSSLSLGAGFFLGVCLMSILT